MRGELPYRVRDFLELQMHGEEVREAFKIARLYFIELARHPSEQVEIEPKLGPRNTYQIPKIGRGEIVRVQVVPDDTPDTPHFEWFFVCQTQTLRLSFQASPESDQISRFSPYTRNADLRLHVVHTADVIVRDAPRTLKERGIFPLTDEVGKELVRIGNGVVVGAESKEDFPAHALLAVA